MFSGNYKGEIYEDHDIFLQHQQYLLFTVLFQVSPKRSNNFVSEFLDIDEERPSVCNNSVLNIYFYWYLFAVLIVISGYISEI